MSGGILRYGKIAGRAIIHQAQRYRLYLHLFIVQELNSSNFFVLHLRPC